MRADRTDSTVAVPVLVWAFVAPLSLGLGSVFTGLILVAGIIATALSADARRTIPWPVWVPLAGLIAWTALATLTASPMPSKWDPWSNELWLKLLLIFLPPLLASRPRLVRRSLWVWLATGALVAAYGIYQHYTGRQLFSDAGTGHQGDRFMAVGFFGHHLTYGGHVLALWCLSASSLLNASLRGRRRAGAVLIFILLSLGLLWSYARSAQLGAAVALLFLGLFLPPRRRWFLAGLVILGTVAVLATPSLRIRFEKALDPTTEETRLNLWKSSVAAIRHRPWTGHGVGNFGEVLEVHEVEGYYDSRAHSHNDYLMHGVNAGIPAILFSVLMTAGILVVLIRHRDRADRWVILGAASANVALAAGGFFQVFQTDDEVEMALYFLTGCALALAAHRREV